MPDRTNHQRVRITKTFVENPKLKPGFYVDSSDPPFGFRLKVTPTGKKVYLVYGKPKGYRNAITVTIGRHGEPKPPDLDEKGYPVKGKDGKPEDPGKWTADKAEKAAQRIWALIHDGKNPNELQKKQVKESQDERAREEGQTKYKILTVRKVFNDYIADKRKRNKIKQSTEYVYRCDLEKCLADWLDRPLQEITEGHIEDRHAEISEEHPGQANHVMRILRALFNFAMENISAEYRTEDREPIIKRNPVTHLSKQDRWNSLKPRKHSLEDHQLKAFFQACRELEHPTASDYLPLLLLTGLRAEEAAALSWGQVDLRSRKIVIHETKNGREHWLPLTDYLYSMLKARWKNRSGAYVFSNGADGYQYDYRYQIERLIERCRVLLAEDDDDTAMHAITFKFIPHDLRRTFAGIAQRSQPQYIVKGLLNHIDSGDVTQTHYLHVDVENLREPLKAINDYILSCAEITEYGGVSTPARKVVKFGKSAVLRRS